jgi:hypothetical protein
LAVSEGCLDAIISRAVESANDTRQQEERAPSVAVLSLLARSSARLKEVLNIAACVPHYFVVLLLCALIGLTTFDRKLSFI